MIIQDNNENREYYKQIFNDDVIEVICYVNYMDQQNVKNVYNKTRKFHNSHGTWKDLAYNNIFMWKTVKVEIIKDLNVFDLFTLKETNI